MKLAHAHLTQLTHLHIITKHAYSHLNIALDTLTEPLPAQREYRKEYTSLQEASGKRRDTQGARSGPSAKYNW